MVSAASRGGPAAWRGTLGFLRERRALGFAHEAGPAGRRHVDRASAPLEGQRQALALLLAGSAVVVVVVAGLLEIGTCADHHLAFLANLFDELGRWWNGLPWWQQALVVGGLAALLTFGGMGFLPALSLASGASAVAAYGQGTASFLRDPRQATRNYVRNLTPAEVVAQLAGMALSRVLPAAAGAAVGKRPRGRAAPVGRVAPGTVLPTPSVGSPRLQNIVDDLYRGTTNPGRIGSGTTADAIRHELRTGQPVFGRTHVQKGEDYLRGLENWLRANPHAPTADRLVARSLADDLLDALGRTP